MHVHIPNRSNAGVNHTETRDSDRKICGFTVSVVQPPSNAEINSFQPHSIAACNVLNANGSTVYNSWESIDSYKAGLIIPFLFYNMTATKICIL